MSSVESAVLVFSAIFIILNIACYYLQREYLHFCLLISVFSLSALGAIIANMDSTGSAPIFEGIMLISGLGLGVAFLFKFIELIRFAAEKASNHQI